MSADDRLPELERMLAESKARQRALEEECTELTQRAQDLFVLGGIAEIIAVAEGPVALVSASIERLGLLHDLPLVACFATGDGAEPALVSAYSARTQRSIATVRLLSGPPLDGRAHPLRATDVIVAFEGEAAQEPLGISEVLTIGVKGLELVPHLFVFGGPGAEPLAELIPLFERVVDMARARLESMALLARLQAMNEELDAQVARRTAELERAMVKREEAMRSLSERANLLDHASWGVAVIDAQDRLVSPINTAFLDLHGLSPSQALGRPLSALCAPESRDALAASLARARRDGRSEHSARHVGARREIPVMVSLVALDLREPSGAMGVYVSDLTERAELEARLVQAQKLEAVGRLAGGIAHDFNNMLFPIIGYSDLALEGMAPGSPEADTLETIRRAANEAADLTRQLLAFSRRQVLRSERVKLDELSHHTVKLLQRVLGEDIVLETRIGTVGEVIGDPSQLQQILMNLALNARDAMPTGGRLWISVEEVVPGDPRLAARNQAGRWILITVADTGVGMPPEVLSQAFDPFFTTKPAGAGTGLGLATVHGVVNQHGGMIEVDSEPGRGTTVSVWLPVAAQPMNQGARMSAAPSKSPAGSGETVLVVDDEPMVREMLARILHHHGYHPLVASDGQEAIAMFSQHAVDLLLTDLVMPGLSGADVTEAFWASFPGRPVVILTGHVRDEARLAPLLSAGARILDKPLRPGDLVRVLEELIASSRRA